MSTKFDNVLFGLLVLTALGIAALVFTNGTRTVHRMAIAREKTQELSLKFGCNDADKLIETYGRDIALFKGYDTMRRECLDEKVYPEVDKFLEQYKEDN